MLTYFLIKKWDKHNASSLEKAWQNRKENKEKAKDKILQFLKKKEKVANDDVQKLLKVSDATATNYLEELEKEGKIIQHGNTGAGVFYTQING